MDHATEVKKNLNKIQPSIDNTIEKNYEKFKNKTKKLFMYTLFSFLTMIITHNYVIKISLQKERNIPGTFLVILFIISTIAFFLLLAILTFKYFFRKKNTLFKEDNQYKLLNKLIFSDNSLPSNEIYGMKLNQESITIVNELKMEIFTIENSELVSVIKKNKIDDTNESYDTSIFENTKYLHIKYTKNNKMYNMFFENQDLELFILLKLNFEFQKNKKEKLEINHNYEIKRRWQEIELLSYNQIKKDIKEHKKNTKKQILYSFFISIILFIFIGLSMSIGLSEIGKFLVILFLLSILFFFISIYNFFTYYDSDYQEDNQYKLLNKLIRTNNSLPLDYLYGIKLEKESIAIVNELKMEIFTIKNSELLSVSEEDKSYNRVHLNNNSYSYSKRISNKVLHIEYHKENNIYDMFFEDPNPTLYALLFSRLPRKKL